ncbi:AAA family ATPase [Globicatella sp. PHS-GS-PNBC-21-1553]|uniref:AAA family ATPase n=1 Tax=Globicatella sp. PHS-GS-PNBC-21-1553 TaxID=2885764 RepID=UPI00298F197A|nr:AAA family ATPase [Globicatella sp. PHS-GS-PNBC-21-1553]WPC07984.1 AAA family ATPase [Globicatella sp. PHS-GS-PNBC-21-1553]
MKIKLNKMLIRNFKGFKQFELVPNGENLAVYGDNGTGKTSLYDAFLWCLFGKNSADQSDTKFDWKPLNSENEPIHHLETEVIVTLDIDGTIKEFGRNIQEKWTKKRGSIAETFDGHTTTYSIDGLNVKQKDFKEALSELIDEETFKMLTKLNYFPEVLDWKKRREALLEMVGDLTDEEVIESNKELAPLNDILDGKSVDERTALVKQQMKQINKDINALPGRIDEVDRSLPDLTNLNKADLETQKLALQADLERKRIELSEVVNGASSVKISSQIKEFEVHKRELEIQYYQREEAGLDELKEKRNEANDLVFEARQKNTELTMKRNELMAKIDSHLKEIEVIKTENDKNRQRFTQIRDEQFPKFDDSKLICPTCGVPFNEHKVFDIKHNHEEQEKQFNADKAARLTQIKEKGIANNGLIAEHQGAVDSLKEQLENLDLPASDAAVKKTQDNLKAIDDEIEKAKAGINPFNDTEEAVEIDMQINALKNQLDAINSDNQSLIKQINLEILEFNSKISEVNDDLYKFELHAKQSLRREELINSEQTLSLEFGKLEQQLFLLEEFIKTKVNLLTDTINNKFNLVKFKLFDTQNNGGITECCEPTVEGVNYSTGLNTANRINAGLDIINVLMKHHDTYVPVFIDNAEGINDILDIDTQIITLSVSKDEKLTIKEQ